MRSKKVIWSDETKNVPGLVETNATYHPKYNITMVKDALDVDIRSCEEKEAGQSGWEDWWS